MSLFTENSVKSSGEKIKTNLLEAKRTAFNSIEIGKATLETLDQQDEMIQEVEDTLEANEQVIQRSVRVLRGMTWAGYLANKASDLRSVFVADSVAPAASHDTNRPRGGAREVSGTSSNQTSSSASLFDASQPFSAAQSPDDEDLREISSAVEVLHQMGVTLGEHLDSQKVTLERVEDKTGRVTDQTLAVTLRTSMMLRKNNRPIQSFVGTFQFIDESSARYLCVSETDGSSLALRPTPDRSTHFHVFVKEQNLFGLLNEKTQRYVGVTVWGSVAALGQYFGTQEECYLDLGGLALGVTRKKGEAPPPVQPTGILLIARHWGAGGWLKVDRGAHSEGQSSGPDEWLVNDTTSSISDKAGAVLLTPIRSRVDPLPQQDT